MVSTKPDDEPDKPSRESYTKKLSTKPREKRRRVAAPPSEMEVDPIAEIDSILTDIQKEEELDPLNADQMISVLRLILHRHGLKLESQKEHDSASVDAPSSIGLHNLGTGLNHLHTSLEKARKLLRNHLYGTDAADRRSSETPLERQEELAPEGGSNIALESSDEAAVKREEVSRSLLQNLMQPLDIAFELTGHLSPNGNATKVTNSSAELDYGLSALFSLGLQIGRLSERAAMVPVFCSHLQEKSNRQQSGHSVKLQELRDCVVGKYLTLHASEQISPETFCDYWLKMTLEDLDYDADNPPFSKRTFRSHVENAKREIAELVRQQISAEGDRPVGIGNDGCSSYEIASRLLRETRGIEITADIARHLYEEHADKYWSLWGLAKKPSRPKSEDEPTVDDRNVLQYAVDASVEQPTIAKQREWLDRLATSVYGP